MTDTEIKKGFLHELLAVEGDLAGVAKKVIEEAEKTFEGPMQHRPEGDRRREALAPG